jgi:hypothetical protein
MTDTGDIVTYEHVLDLLGIEHHGGNASDVLSGIVSNVNKRLHRAGDWRHLVNVVKVGYRIGSPAEVRSEVLGRMRWVDRQNVSALRAIEKVVRHPDATIGERQRAANAAAAQSALLQLVRREHRKVRSNWPEEETSPVPPVDRDIPST